MAIGVMTRIEDLNTVLSQTQDHRQRVLVAAAKNIKVWFIKVAINASCSHERLPLFCPSRVHCIRTHVCLTTEC